MNYFKMFREVGILDNDSSFFNICSFDIDNNCQKSIEVLFELVDEVYTNNDFKTDLNGFILELKNLYKEVGFNLGCLFIERHIKTEFSLNFCDTNKLEMRNILNLNGYIDIIFNRMSDILINPDIENFFTGMQNTISMMKRELVVGSGVPEEAFNFVINSAELRKMSYSIIKTGFKFGFFIFFSYKTLHMHLTEEAGNYLPGD